MKFTSLVSTALLGLSLGAESILAQHISSQNIVPGIYQFTSIVNDENGNRLAVTDQGLNQPIIVTPLVLGQANQLWNVTRADNPNLPQHIIIAPSSTNGSIFTVGFTNGVPGPLSTVNQQVAWQNQFVDQVGFTWIDAVIGSTAWALNLADSGATLMSSTFVANFPTGNFSIFWVPVRVS